MALPTFDKQSDIPKGFEDEYEEQDGKWVPVNHMEKLERALEAEKKGRSVAEAAARAAKKEAQEAITKKMASASGMSEEELRKIHSSIEANLRTEYEPKIADYDKLQSEVRSLKLDSKVKELFKAHGALPKHIEDFWKLYGDEFDLTADGKPMVRNEPGKDVAKHVQGVLKGRAEWVQGTKASGSGSGTSTTAASTGKQGGLTWDDVVKNPQTAIASANEG